MGLYDTYSSTGSRRNQILMLAWSVSVLLTGVVIASVTVLVIASSCNIKYGKTIVIITRFIVNFLLIIRSPILFFCNLQAVCN